MKPLISRILINCTVTLQAFCDFFTRKKRRIISAIMQSGDSISAKNHCPRCRCLQSQRFRKRKSSRCHQERNKRDPHCHRANIIVRHLFLISWNDKLSIWVIDKNELVPQKKLTLKNGDNSSIFIDASSIWNYWYNVVRYSLCWNDSIPLWGVEYIYVTLSSII